MEKGPGEVLTLNFKPQQILKMFETFFCTIQIVFLGLK